MQPPSPEAPSLCCAVRAHRGELAVLALAGGGARLASGGGDGALALWEWRAGAGWAEAARRSRAHRYGLTAAAWAGGGALLASGGVDGALRVWGRGLAARRELAAPGAPAVRALCWLGGARLAAGHDDGGARLWAVRRGALLARLEARGGALLALQPLALRRAPLLVAACEDGALRVYDLAEVCSGDGAAGAAGEAARVEPLAAVEDAHDLGVLCCAAAPGGAPGGMRLATGGADARVRVWTWAGRALAPAAALEGHAAAVTALAWGARGVLASASLDRSARLWAAGACLHVLHAHARYLTCVALGPGLRYLLTGSNDRTFRTWSLGAFTLDDELPAPCNVMAHFALGDLEGIGPVEEDEDPPESERAERGDDEGDASCAWSERAHDGAINCIAAQEDILATASSDGTVAVWHWAGEARLTALHRLRAHRYPALACALGAGGGVLASCALDGTALLWDARAGVQVRALAVPRAASGEGGGARDVRLSAGAAPRVLLATDDGLVAVWRAAAADARPAGVSAGAAAALCCAWGAAGALVAVGGAAGELRVLAPPGLAELLLLPDAHDLGVTSCDFNPAGAAAALGLPPDRHLLASAGNDSRLRLWTLHCAQDAGGAPTATVVGSSSVVAHGGAVACVRWAPDGGALLASAGSDGWVRAWRVAVDLAGAARATPHAAAHVFGGAAAALCVHGLLAAGSLGGRLALWRTAPAAEACDDDDAAPRLWREAGAARWLREHVTRGMAAPAAAGLTGARLLDAAPAELAAALGLAGDAVLSARLEEELAWLRAPDPEGEEGEEAPHGLLCPLSHAVLRWPASAADGFTYERDNIREWLLAAPPEGAVSPMTGRRLRSTRLTPNHGLRDVLRARRMKKTPTPVMSPDDDVG